MATEYEVDRMVVRLIGDQKSYQKMLDDVEKQTKESANWAEGQGSRISNAFTKAFKTAQGFVASTGQQFQRAGAASMAGAAAIQAPLGKAALDFSEYGKSIKDMVVESEKAATKAKEMKKWVLEGTEAYKELNKVIKLTTEQAAVFRLMSERTGESVEDLTKTIKTNSKEYETWRKEAEKFGLILSKDQVKAADDLAESWQRVKEVGKGLWVQIGAAVAPMWKEFNDLIVGSIQWVVKWVKENQELIKSVAKFAEKLMIVGGALTAVGTVLTTTSALLGPIVAAVTAGAAAWLAWDTATGKFLQGSAMQVWEQYGNTVKNVVGQVMEYGREILAFTDKVMTGVFNAVKAGNLGLAVDILWSGAKVAWIKSLNEIDKLTGERFSGILKNLEAGNWKSTVEALWVEVQIAWLKGLNLVNDAWGLLEQGFSVAINEIQKVWNTFMGFFEKGIQKLLLGLGDLLNWITQNSGKIGAMITIGALIKGEGVVKATAMGAAGSVAARVIGAEASEAVARLPIFEARNAEELNRQLDEEQTQKQEIQKAARQVEKNATGLKPEKAIDVITTAIEEFKSQKEEFEAVGGEEVRVSELNKVISRLEKQQKIYEELFNLEQRRNDLAKEGKEDAAEQLRIQQEQLDNELKQAEAAAEKAEADRANARETQAEVMRLTELREKETQRISKQEQYKEQFDPVFKYMKDLKQLNAAFNESERSAKTYQLALKAIKQELVQRSLSLEIHVSMTGLDAVRKGTSEWVQMMKNAGRMSMTQMVEKEMLGKAETEQAKLNKEAAQAGQAQQEVKQAQQEVTHETFGRNPEEVKELEEQARAAGMSEEEISRLATDPFPDQTIFEAEQRPYREELERAQEAVRQGSDPFDEGFFEEFPLLNPKNRRVESTEPVKAELPEEIKLPEEVAEAKLPEPAKPPIEEPQAELPEVEVPELSLPEAEVPEIEIPEVEIAAELPERGLLEELPEEPTVEMPEERLNRGQRGDPFEEPYGFGERLDRGERLEDLLGEIEDFQTEKPAKPFSDLEKLRRSDQELNEILARTEAREATDPWTRQEKELEAEVSRFERKAPTKPRPELAPNNQDQIKMLEKLERIAASTEKTANKPTYQVEMLEIIA